MKITRDIRDRFASTGEVSRFVAGLESALAVCGRTVNGTPSAFEPAVGAPGTRRPQDPAAAVTGPEPESAPQ